MESAYKSKSLQKNLIVEYKNELYDLTEFASKHPGGKNILERRNNKNIEIDFKNFDHSIAAEYLMKEYKIKSGCELSESIEHLVDWNKGMVAQISGIGENYFEWVNLPVDRPLRLFDNQYIELITKTPWYLPLLFWIPVIIHCILDEISHFNETIDIYSTIFTRLLFGVFVWTLVEYLLHRFLFHIDVNRYKNWKTFHFMIHGLHHKTPFDEYRLVFPPIPAALIAIILYQPIRILFIFNLIDYPKLLMSGCLIGYLCYDMTHYYIHFGSPYIRYFYNLKRCHYYHHFVDHNNGFGISNSFWDQLSCDDDKAQGNSKMEYEFPPSTRSVALIPSKH